MVHPITSTPPIALLIPSGPPSWQAAILLDLLAAAWGFTHDEMEHDILGVPEGTLRAWGNSYPAVWNADLAKLVSALGRLHRAIWLAGLDHDYPAFWRRRLRADSPLGPRSPFEAISQDGVTAVLVIERYYGTAGL